MNKRSGRIIILFGHALALPKRSGTKRALYLAALAKCRRFAKVQHRIIFRPLLVT